MRIGITHHVHTVVVGGTGDFDRVLVGLEAGLVPRILSSRSKKTKSDLACPLRLLLSMIFQYVVIKFSLSPDITCIHVHL